MACSIISLAGKGIQVTSVMHYRKKTSRWPTTESWPHVILGTDGLKGMWSHQYRYTVVDMTKFLAERPCTETVLLYSTLE